MQTYVNDEILVRLAFPPFRLIKDHLADMAKRWNEMVPSWDKVRFVYRSEIGWYIVHILAPKEEECPEDKQQK
jgi:hypothetical protein